ncbi:HEXXH motif domain-containing protein [Verrucosispora sp. NA02020]|uniref:HEXXH motif domain-containing protein n=1 Tax=Verrucosispora sp. NA02020 TaxID=2742132 RepID=UPI00159032B3|nr:HEXXH motif domain-containing protein [Verrucosispora sp. NA02020]QKW12470.1 HEXXH motif domain-containing protein [Verrucosispora sp. NA02020]
MTAHHLAAEPVGRPARHRLDPRHFGALATGSADADTIAELLAAESSWRKIQLRAVLDAAAGVPDATGPLPPVAEAWRLLVAAQRRDREVVEKLILHPQVGTWAGYALRRMRGTTVTATGPLWVDLGYLHALAVAAAVRTGCDFTMRVPVRDGFVVLPTLGGARVPKAHEWDEAEIVGGDGRATVTVAGTVVEFDATGGGTDGWVPLPTVRSTAGGHTLEVTLDFIDPYRNLRTPTAPHLDIAADVRRWRELLDQAWALLVRACPDLAVPIARGLTSVVPQPAAERFRTMSASAGDAFGSMIVSEPEDAPELAVTLVHEFQHIKLGGLLHLAPLIEGEPPHRLYAPWRDDPRPLGGLIQGVYAFVGIVEFWRAYRQVATGTAAGLAHFEFARWREQVWATLRMMRDLPQLTDVGRHLVEGLTTTALGWQEEPVPADPLAAARAAVADHRARWRTHHLRPAPEVVSAVVAAWIAGQPVPTAPDVAPTVEADAAARRLDTRAVLELWRITDPEGFDRLRTDASAVGARVSGAGPAELAHVCGEVAQAQAGYLRALSTEPGSPAAWAGLGQTAGDIYPGPAADALRDRPELVRAVYLGLRDQGTPVPEPLELAAWIGAGKH